MYNHRRHKPNSSGDNFTFPAMSPEIELESELADHLFSNGKFLLHTFPLQPKGLTSCTLSRTNSVTSKDSLMSSRSNSTNSRSSTSSSSSNSSARTSTSEASSSSGAAAALRIGGFPQREIRSPVHYCNNNYNLPAQRWQFMAPVPVLNRRASGRRKGSPEKKKCGGRKGYCRRFFRWIVSTCKECHAMEPSKNKF